MNVLVFVSDALRPDHLSCYGHDRLTSPELDKLALDGVVFDNAFSQAIWTVPSSASILSSQYPLTHGCLFLERSLSERSPPLSVPLKRAGAKTALVTDMFQIRRERGFDRGFDTYRYILDEDERGRSIDSPTWVADTAIEWIEENAEEDFFLFVWSSGTHTPYETPRPPRFASEDHPIDGSVESLDRGGVPRKYVDHVKNLYDDTISYADEEFGRLLDVLRKLDIYDETAIVFTSDHGEMFDEHARFEQTRFRSALKRLTPRRIQEKQQLFEPGAAVGHMAVLPYEEVIRVPLVMKLPNSEFAGRRVDHFAQSIDIGPSVVEMMDVELPETMQGKSLLPTIRDDMAVNKYVYSSSSIMRSHVYYHSVRGTRHKYVKMDSDGFDVEKVRVNPSKVIPAQAFKFLHPDDLLLTLPDELVNVIDIDTKTAEEYRSEFERWERSIRTGGSLSPEARLDETSKEQLRQLGYLN